MKKIVESVLVGIREAAKRYEKMTNGYWLSDSGVENLIQSYVANKCYEHCHEDGFFVHLEARVDYFFERPKDLRRVDLIISDEMEIPKYLIEIKRGKDWTGRDIGKIHDALISFRRKGDKKLTAAFWGCFVYWYSGMKTKNIDDEIEAIKNRFEKNFNSKLVSYEWDKLNIGKLVEKSGDGKETFYQSAALVASITRKV